MHRETKLINKVKNHLYNLHYNYALGALGCIVSQISQSITTHSQPPIATQADHTPVLMPRPHPSEGFCARLCSGNYLGRLEQITLHIFHRARTVRLVSPDKQ